MIGVAISTLNRREKALETVHRWRDLMPPDSHLVVVDDGSDAPFPAVEGVTVVHHQHRMGVAFAKNTGIETLYELGCDHLFLADDDVHPKAPEWWRGYIESPEPHLAFQWADRHRKPWRLIHDDGHHFSIGFPRGVLLYITREAVNVVGGMDVAHGTYSGEHVEWSQRIHDAGLTTWPFADICGSDQLWYAEDKEKGNTYNSTFSLKDRVEMGARAGKIWDKKRPAFISFRKGIGVQSFDLGPTLTDSYTGTLEHVLGLRPSGVALEFGVGAGGTLRLIAKTMETYGFDSFQGLPDDWREGFPKGTFACEPPTVPGAEIVEGLFDQTLPQFTFPDHVGLIHFDADLYESTKTILDHVGPHIQSGTYLVFDEWHGFPGAHHKKHEQRAFREWAKANPNVGWEVIGHGPEQWAVRIA